MIKIRNDVTTMLLLFANGMESTIGKVVTIMVMVVVGGLCASGVEGKFSLTEKCTLDTNLFHGIYEDICIYFQMFK